MKILAIETSCDETAISVVECTGNLEAPEFEVLAQQVSSQVKLHAEFGGVVPSLAKREHIKNLPLVLTKTLNSLGWEEKEVKEKIDAVAVTIGPGLEPALWTGITFAEELATKLEKPLIPANHLEGHIVSPLITGEQVKMPALALIISGGHTELVLVKSWGEYEKLGATRDDAVGEAFDKAARLLGLPYPGGPEITRLAQTARDKNLGPKWSLPRPMLHSGDLSFSFSGLKTALRYSIEKYGELNEEEKQIIASEFEDAVIEVLLAKTSTALEETGAQSLIIGGGVIANQTLREAFSKMLAEKHLGVDLALPPSELATDNATMIAMAAYLRYLKNEFIAPDKINSTPLTANGNLNF